MKASIWEAGWVGTLPTPAQLRHAAFLRFGAEVPSALSAPLDGIGDRLRGEWLRAAAEEWMAAVNGGAVTEGQVPDWLLNVSPLDDGIPLKQRLTRVGSLACFPLDGSGHSRGQPAVGHLWRFDGDPCDRLLCSLPGEPLSGDSLGLASALAAKAANPCATHAIRRALARDWMISGEVVQETGAVSWVALGNKLDIEHHLAGGTRRTWLLPGGVRGRIPVDFPAPIRFVSTVQAAWEAVSGSGIVDSGALEWPEAPAMHSFVSGAVEPVIALALAARPSQIVLWHTDNTILSQIPAGTIRDVLERKGIAVSKILTRPIDSGNVSRIEIALREGLAEDLRNGSPVLFNGTQGNRWMAIALNNLARLHENLWFVYRDLDAPDWRFNVLVHDGVPPSAYVLDASLPPVGVRADALFRKPAARAPEDSESMLARLFEET